MKEEKTIDSNRLSFGKRTYFFDVKEASNGSKYLKITESRFVKEGERKRNVFILFKDDLKGFMQKVEDTQKQLA